MDEFLLDDRSWMYKRLINGAYNIQFMQGLEIFLKFAISNSEVPEIRCPCMKCKNIVYKHPNEVREHLMRKGFVENYYDWRCHCNVLSGESSSSTNRNELQLLSPVQINEDNSYVRMVHGAAASRFPDTFQTLNDEHSEEPLPLQLPEDPNPQAKQFFDMLSAANNPLYPGCKTYTQMSMIGRLTNLKSDFRIPERLYDELCLMMKEALPEPNTMTTGFYDTKKQIAGLGLPVEKIDCCSNGCMIYWGDTANARCCGICRKSRWKIDSNENKRIPRKHFFYFPLGPRLQRLYASQVTAHQMRWHAEHRSEEGEMCHPLDSEAWLKFNADHPDFASETRNVRLGLCTDGFNPFGSSGKQYSSWPVILTPYNLPPWLCMKKPYMFLTMIAPGPKNPKHNIDLYL